MAKENMYWDDNSKIFRILNRYLQESLILAPIITVMILFCNLKMHSLCVEFPHKNSP